MDGLKITKEDAELIRVILGYWDTLSNNYAINHLEVLDCTTDHCHTEYMDAELLADKLENIVSLGQEFF